MTDLTLATPSPRPLRTRLRDRKHTVTFVIALTVYAGLSYAILASSGHPPLQFRLDISPLLRSPWVLKAHVIGAVASFAIGSVLLLGAKGRRMHRILGYGWVATMSVTAISSFFLVGLNGSNFSFIHAISAWAVIVLPMGIAAARRHDITAHRRKHDRLVCRRHGHCRPVQLPAGPDDVVDFLRRLTLSALPPRQNTVTHAI